MEGRRLLIVVNSAWFFVSHRLPLAIAARDRGFDVYVACGVDDEAESEPIRRAGFGFARIDLRRGSFNPVSDMSLAWSLYGLYRKIRPDVVHHVTIKPVLYGSLAARAAGVPATVNAISGVGYLFSSSGAILALIRQGVSPLYRVALRGPRTRVIFQNQHDLESFAAVGLVRRDTAVVIGGSGVDLSEFRYVPEPEGVPTVLLPARMLRDKGIFEFAEAGRLLRSRGVVARFMLVGRLDSHNPAAIPERELLALCADAGAEWLGYRSNMSELMRAAAIVCLPSYREGFPKALAEAAASGRPTVTCDVPGCRDALVPGETGLVVPARSAAALADALEELLHSREKRSHFGAAGRKLAEQKFDVREIVRRQVDLYEELLG